MKKKWMARAAALLAVVLFACIGWGWAEDAPEAAQEPAPVVEAPAPAPVVEAPAPAPVEEAPAPAPVEEAPAAEPETAAEPAAAREEASQPEAPAEPAAPVEPTAPSEPEAPSEPVESAEPEASGEPEPSSDPEASEEPETITDPEALSEQEALAGAEATPEPEPTIVSFEALANPVMTVAEKPTLEEALAMLPTTLNAALSNGETIGVPVTWTCEHYEEERSEYVFLPTLGEGAPLMDEAAELPMCTLVVEVPATFTVDDLTWRREADGTLTLVGCAKNEGSIAVPAEVDGAKAAAIAATAFSAHDGLAEIVIPDGVTAIEAGAFAGCAALKKVTLPDSLRTLGEKAFEGCAALERLTLSVEHEPTMTAQNAFFTTRKAEDGTEIRDEVSLGDQKFTDIAVGAGTLTLDGAAAVESERQMTVSDKGTLKITQQGVLTVLGTLENRGTVDNQGSILACGGTVTGVDSAVTEHRYEDGRCAVCGAEEPQTEPEIHALTAEAIQTLSKVYDGTSAFTASPDAFRLNGADGLDVSIAQVAVTTDARGAGTHAATASFTLAGADAAICQIADAAISVQILPKDVAVKVTSGLSKTYGDKDPKFGWECEGMLSEDGRPAGDIDREKGENARSYAFTVGTLPQNNPNYHFTVSGSFVINRRNITDSSVTVEAIRAQRYTGEAIEPEVTISYNGTALKKDVDYSVRYANNVRSSARATVRITGAGNFTGSKTAYFSIVKVRDQSDASLRDDEEEVNPSDEQPGESSSSGLRTPRSANRSSSRHYTRSRSSSASFAELPGSQSGERTDEDTGDATGVLPGLESAGAILFDENYEPQPFAWDILLETLEPEVEGEEPLEVQWLYLESAPLKDEEGNPLPGVYGKPRLRLTENAIDGMMDDLELYGIHFVVGEAEADIPLSELSPEMEVGEEVREITAYEFRIWEADELETAGLMELLPVDVLPEGTVVHTEALALMDGDVAFDNRTLSGTDASGVLTGFVLRFPVENVEEAGRVLAGLPDPLPETDDPEAQESPVVFTEMTAVKEEYGQWMSVHPAYNGCCLVCWKAEEQEQ